MHFTLRHVLYSIKRRIKKISQISFSILFNGHQDHLLYNILKGNLEIYGLKARTTNVKFLWKSNKPNKTMLVLKIIASFLENCKHKCPQLTGHKKFSVQKASPFHQCKY